MNQLLLHAGPVKWMVLCLFLLPLNAQVYGQNINEARAYAADKNFEKAAEIHARLTRVESAAAGVSAAVHALAELNGVIVQPACKPGYVALFLLTRGSLAGPALYSVAGMRHPNEQSGSSSLFAHPAALAPVPLEETPLVRLAARDALESRLDDALNTLAVRSVKSTQQMADHLCLFSRWYYRPQARRVGAR